MKTLKKLFKKRKAARFCRKIPRYQTLKKLNANKLKLFNASYKTQSFVPVEDQFQKRDSLTVSYETVLYWKETIEEKEKHSVKKLGVLQHCLKIVSNERLCYVIDLQSPAFHRGPSSRSVVIR